MGGRFSSPNGVQACCDVCTPKAIDCSLDILQPGTCCRAAPRKAVREISDELKEVLTSRLSTERELILEENPGLRIFGRDFIYPDPTISLLCKEARYVTSPSDLNFYGIERLNIRARLFNVITDVVADAPPPNKRRRKR
jgi:hypothetical protein